jgi:phosphatidylserine decarboxylase
MKYPKCIDRQTGCEVEEKIYGNFFMSILYNSSFVSRVFLFLLMPFLSGMTYFYGMIQRSWWSKRKVKPFIKKFHIDAEEFQDSVESFSSFNDFFIRKLRSSARPIVSDRDVAILPADARYLVYENIQKEHSFLVKGRFLCLETLLQDRCLAKKYASGVMVVARLAPVDYHRFHFPVDCIPSPLKKIGGHLYSVNPKATKNNLKIVTENRRVITILKTDNFGSVLFIGVGATLVGRIHQTFIPGLPYSKGEEMGYFSFGGSCVILLFEPKAISIDEDLNRATSCRIEVIGKFGQSLGRNCRTILK